LDVVERDGRWGAIGDANPIGVRGDRRAHTAAVARGTADRRREEERDQEPPPTAKGSKSGEAAGREQSAQCPRIGVAREAGRGQTRRRKALGTVAGGLRRTRHAGVRYDRGATLHGCYQEKPRASINRTVRCTRDRKTHRLGGIFALV
jgi:hypothetical protein